MDDELFRVPGMANELMNLTLANAPRPNPPLAFMGALAMVWAISENPKVPRITPEAITLDSRFVAYATKQMLARSAFYVAEGSFGKLKGRALSMLEKRGGTLDRSTWLKNLNIPLATFRNLIATLDASDLIEASVEEHGKVVYTIKK